MAKTPITVKWLYGSAQFDDDERTVWLALLQVFDDGTAEVLTDNAETLLHFEDEVEANMWLADEEFMLLKFLIEVLHEEGSPFAESFAPPQSTNREELKGKMTRPLKDMS